ncbi:MULTISPECIES: hypothetical protein [unclassified Clostridium]|uniref:hypothetical protein n=1 Tax=unclassified Clostridium TaxID=2614128 RepID=UPI003217B2CD
MSINNITGNYGGYLNSLSMKNSEIKGVYSSKNSVGKSSEFKDILDISTSRKNILRTNDIGGITIDKGTAANTTLYVDRASFNQIMNYTTNNPACQWEELGIDDEKRWIVVNGQRFECPLSEEEKELRRRLRKGLVEMLDEADKEREKHKSKSERHGSVKISFDENNKIKLNGDVSLQSSDKIKNLMNNDKVMMMLTDIMNMNGGQGVMLSL